MQQKRSAARPRRRKLNTQSYVDGVLAGDRTILSRAITLIESTRADHQQQARALMTALMPHTGRAYRVGVSGVPGVGKSTFIECLGMNLVKQNRKLAVLTVDPSSSLSGGSILGDKTRMAQLSRQENAYIRPSPSAGTLGGVAAKTRETMLLCDAAGFDLVLVETVGVGQSETLVAQMTDFFLALMLPGAGDELQGIKRGILELADMLVVNKADGDNQTSAKLAARQYRAALRLMTPVNPAWRPPVLTCSSLTGDGVDQVWRKVTAHHEQMEARGDLATKRAGQLHHWMWQLIEEELLRRLHAHPNVAARLSELEAMVTAGKLAPSMAAFQVLADFLPNESK